jgi:molybdopterin molybdotransferase
MSIPNVDRRPHGQSWDGPRSLAEHRAQVLDVLAARPPGPAVTVPLADAHSRVLASEVRTDIDLPPFANSQMDGFAVAAAATPGMLPVGPTVAAGAWPDPLPPGTAVPIMTGAPIPPGADTVVPIEETPERSFDTATVTLPEAPAGRFVRAQGSDLAAGEVLLPAGSRLGAVALGALAASGLPAVTVRPRPRVLIYTGGDEVVLPGSDRGPGQIYDANGAILSGFLASIGAAVSGVRLIDDTPGDFARHLQQDLGELDPDLVITSGGISAGRFEVVRTALTSEQLPGAEVGFGSVAMQPGGPQGLGVLAGTVPIVCLPGNPVSTWVSALILLQPALAALWQTLPTQPVPVRLTEEVVPLPAKVQIRRGVYASANEGAEGGASGAPSDVRLLPGTSSHLLAEAARAEVLVPVPAGERSLPAGTVLEGIQL